MARDDHHSAFVTSWLDATAAGASAQQLLELFELGLVAIWTRAHITLGEVTLTAILDRVIHDAAETHPMVAELVVEPGGLRFDGMRAAGSSLSNDAVAEAVRTVLSALLAVLGNLTAEILTPALHAALARVASPTDRDRTGGKDAP